MRFTENIRDLKQININVYIWRIDIIEDFEVWEFESLRVGDERVNDKERF